MATRKTARPEAVARKSPRKRPPDSAMRQFSAITGAVLVGMALLWFVWLLVRQLSPGLVSITFPLPNVMMNSASGQSDPLAAAGITLSSPAQGQEPLLTERQALLLANQIEPGVAGRAGGVDAQYTLFSYHSANSSYPDFHNVPIWLIHYTQISEPPPNTSADPHASTTHHDFYVFLDANSGRELLAIWL